MLGVHEQHTGHPGDASRHGERSQPRTHEVHGVRGRRPLIVPGGDEYASAAVLAERHRRQHGDDEEAQTHEIEGAVVLQIDAAVQERSGDLGCETARQQVPAEPVVLPEDVTLHGVSERQRGHRQVQALDADRGQPDDQGHDHPSRDPDTDGEEEVDVVVGDQPTRGGGAGADQPELAETDLARPPRQHDEGNGDDPEDRQDDQQREVGPAHDERQHDSDEGGDAKHSSTRDPHLANAAQLRRDGAVLLDHLPCRRA